jgi:hypothetical protein
VYITLLADPFMQDVGAATTVKQDVVASVQVVARQQQACDLQQYAW